jgi:hypothetical protein
LEFQFLGNRLIPLQQLDPLAKYDYWSEPKHLFGVEGLFHHAYLGNLPSERRDSEQASFLLGEIKTFFISYFVNSKLHLEFYLNLNLANVIVLLYFRNSQRQS